MFQAYSFQRGWLPVRIRTAIHPEGYTCSLTLSPAGYKTASNTNSVEAGVGKSKPKKRAKDGGEEKPVKSGGVNIDLSMVTRDEMEYFASKAGNIKEAAYFHERLITTFQMISRDELDDKEKAFHDKLKGEYTNDKELLRSALNFYMSSGAMSEIAYVENLLGMNSNTDGYGN